MASFSIVDALTTLTTSIPDWAQRLDDLNGQIALRQIELAQLTDQYPPTRSLKNKGSTESLRPKDSGDSPFTADNVEEEAANRTEPYKSSQKSTPNSTTTSPRPGSPAAARVAPLAKNLTPPSQSSANHTPIPNALSRQSSQPTPPAHNRPSQPSQPVLRKRKTESLTSAESLAPKYRTRSMIIIYYDGAVQTAFEELVKFISASRNAMRKGKMAAKMAEMRRAAEAEMEGDEEEDEGRVGGVGALLAAQNNTAVNMEGNALTKGGAGAVDSDGEYAMPKLKFVSTRRMGPSRDTPSRENMGSTLSLGMLRGYRRGSRDVASDIFDELDKGLEWCQSQCEHAAHQFLRDGDCSTEISNIKRKLGEVKETAEKEVEKLNSEPTNPSPSNTRETKSRGLKSVHMRRGLGTMKDLEVDMDIDEGFDDLDPPELVWKSARDIGH